MIDVYNHASELLAEWELYRFALPRAHVLDIQADKDHMSLTADLLRRNLLWGSDLNELTELCYKFDRDLTQFKDKIVIELLTGGAA